MARVFISYRRDEAAYAAYLIRSRLGEISRSDIFLDIETLEMGKKFVSDICQAAYECEVMVVVIGKQWLDIRDDAGNRRLDDPEDILRQEIAIGLKRDIHVIPVLIDGAKMPKKKDLPDDLKPLTERMGIPSIIITLNTILLNSLSQLRVNLG